MSRRTNFQAWALTAERLEGRARGMTTRYCRNTSDYLLANSPPDGIALVDAGKRYTFEQLCSAAGRLAAELAALDLRPSSRVGILGPNSFFWTAAYLAVMK